MTKEELIVALINATEVKYDDEILVSALNRSAENGPIELCSIDYVGGQFINIITNFKEVTHGSLDTQLDRQGETTKENEKEDGEV